MFVDHGLGDLRPGGDLLHAGTPEPLLGEQRACDLEQLLAALMAAHPRTGRLLGFTHASMMPCEAMPWRRTSKNGGCGRLTLAIFGGSTACRTARVGRHVAGRVPPGAHAL